MKRLTFSFFLGLVASCAYGNNTVSTVTALPTTQKTPQESTIKVQTKNAVKFEWTENAIRQYIQSNGVSNTYAAASISLRSDIEACGSKIEEAQSILRQFIQQHKISGVDPHICELLKHEYKDCLDELSQEVAKNCVGCISALSKFRERVQSLYSRLYILTKDLRASNNSTELFESIIQQLDKIFSKEALFSKVLHQVAADERRSGWVATKTPWL